MAEKSEKATPKKLKDARKKGQVAKSKDFPSAFTFIVSISMVLYSAGFFYQQLGGFIIEMFNLSGKHDLNLQNSIGAYVSRAIEVIYQTSFPIMVIVSIIGVVINFLIIGPVFSFEAMKPDIKKLNPVTNIKNIFKVKTFIELLKSIAKIAGALLLIYSVVYNSLGEIMAAVSLPVVGSAMIFGDFLTKVVVRVGIFFIAVGLFDLVFQKRNFAKEMKMEKFEVKQEVKDTEGDPLIKSKRREKAREIAYQDGPQATQRAKAVVTNPTHIAVAIEYEPDEMPAPKVVTMGLDLMAEKIIGIAVDNNIPVMRNIALAHTLYEKSDIGGFVPEETYEAISEILKWIEHLESRESKGFNLELFNE